jgi:AcrR family transcriptional regulator
LINENLIAELVARGTVHDTLRRLSADKKERLYRTALHLFGKFGYDGTAVDRYCREAGISKGSFFQYFPSKLHLLEFAVIVFDDYLEQVVVELKTNEPSGHARDRLRYLYQSLVVNSRLFSEAERFYTFVVHGLEHAAVSLEGLDIARHFEGYVREIIVQGEESGEIRGDFDPELTSQLCSAVLEALARRRYIGRDRPRRQIEEYLISFLFDGIKT